MWYFLPDNQVSLDFSSLIHDSHIIQLSLDFKLFLHELTFSCSEPLVSFFKESLRLTHIENQIIWLISSSLHLNMLTRFSHSEWNSFLQFYRSWWDLEITFIVSRRFLSLSEMFHIIVQENPCVADRLVLTFNIVSVLHSKVRVLIKHLIQF